MDENFSFGYWVRRRRKALDLTQVALAGRVGCSESLLRKIEADARRPSRQLAMLLADALQLRERERDAFLKTARRELAPHHLVAPDLDGSPPTAALPPHPALPAPSTALVGRGREVAALRTLLTRPAAKHVWRASLPPVSPLRVRRASPTACAL